MKIQHTFGIWPLELLTIQRFSYTVDKIPSHRMIVSDCNIESRWQKRYSCAFLLLTPSSSIPYYQVFVSWCLLRWPPLTFFLFLHFAITGQKPESDPNICLLKLAWKFIHAADKNCCSEGGPFPPEVWDCEQLWVLGGYLWLGGLALGGVAAPTCAGLTVVSFVWKDKPHVNKVWNVRSRGRFSFGISFGPGSP